VPALLLASEQFVKLAHTVMRAKASPEALVVPLPGNPSYAGNEDLEAQAEVALEELVKRFRDYPA
jgi:hypothetical protein